MAFFVVTWAVFRLETDARQGKAKMCNGRRHVPLCPASANKIHSAKVQL